MEIDKRNNAESNEPDFCPDPSKELLSFLSSEYKMDIESARSELDMKKDEKYRSMHNWKVWQGSNGKWYTYVGQDRETRKQIKKNSEADMNAFIIDYYKTIYETPTFEMVYYKWVNQKKERGDISLQSYDRYNNQFKRFFVNNPLAKKVIRCKVCSMTTDMLDDFLYPSIKSLNMSRKDFSSVCTIIRGVMRYSVQKHYTNFDITNYIGCLDRPRHGFRKTKKPAEEEAFSIEEMNMLISYLLEENDSHALGLILLFETGMRVGELATLKKRDVKGDLICIERTEIHHKDENTGANVTEVSDFTKTEAGTRTVAVLELGQKIIQELLQRNPESEWLLCDENGTRIRELGFRKKLYRACDSVGIPRRSPHKARKTYATNLIYSGVNEDVVKYLMGHEDISTTRRCYVVARADMDFIRSQLAKTKTYRKIQTVI